ncbi:serine hydrolase [Cyanobium gracile]|uniref:Serine hydrolase n=1 Tax=Cyanobium gracile UHCC 0281 TaxID=3110309 RepID=A0ABU5SX77_9CYAN|nr:serine hydrolase [Cyanobium gracile]MEA5443124.1 serine hydrolase [Cyanobium gracile UHCC 0281]
MSAGRPSRPPGNPWLRPVGLVLRLIVLGVGLGVIVGTALKLLEPRLVKGAIGTPAPGTTPMVKKPGTGAMALGRFEPRQELVGLSQQWTRLAAAQKDLTASGFLLVLDDGRFAQMQPDLALPAASAIKVPILLASLEDLDGGKLRWNEPMPLTKEVVGGGAGWMANKPLGTRFPFFEAATEMIRVSDNTATNLLIRRLGGKTTLNSRFRGLGLPATVVNNWLPDLDGTNTTSSRDLARSIALVDTGDKLTPRARDLFREIMATSRTNTLIPLGLLLGMGKDSSDPDSELLPKGITVYNKTGDIGIAYADAALIQLPDGQRAVAAFMVKGPFNDPRSAELIRAMAGAVAKTLVKGQ